MILGYPLASCNVARVKYDDVVLKMPPALIPCQPKRYPAHENDPVNTLPHMYLYPVRQPTIEQPVGTISHKIDQNIMLIMCFQYQSG